MLQQTLLKLSCKNKATIFTCQLEKQEVRKAVKIKYNQKSKTLTFTDIGKPNKFFCIFSLGSFKMSLLQYARFEFEPKSFVAWSHLKVTTSNQHLWLKFATKAEAIEFLLAINWTRNQIQQ